MVLGFIQAKTGSPLTYDVIFTKIKALRSMVAQFVVLNYGLLICESPES